MMVKIGRRFMFPVGWFTFILRICPGVCLTCWTSMRRQTDSVISPTDSCSKAAVICKYGVCLSAASSLAPLFPIRSRDFSVCVDRCVRFGGGHVERKFFPRLESRVMFIYEYTVPCDLFVSNPTEIEIMWTKSPTQF